MNKLRINLFFVFILTLFVFAGSVCVSSVEVNAVETDQGRYDGYIVKVKDDATANVSLLDNNVSEVGDGFYVVNSLEAAESFADESNIEYIEPNYIVTLFEYPNDTNDPYYSSYQKVYMDLISASSAWSEEYNGNGVTVAVIDSGVVNGHVDIDYTNVLDGTYYYMNSIGTSVVERTGSNYTADVTGHGSFVTGIIAAQINNSIGIAGMTDEVNILPLKCFDSENTTIAQIIAAIQDAIVADVDVINMSFGTEGESESLEYFLQSAANAGIILVAAAGNNGDNTVNYPAAYDFVISVGSVDTSGTVSYFSQRNDSVWVTAPGEDIESLDYESPTKYCSKNGTSFAAPFVTAMAAIAKQYDEGIDVYDMKDLLKNSAVDAGTTGWDSSYGYGIINVNNFISELELEAIYELDGGTLDTAAADYVSLFKTSDTPVTLPEPTKSGYNFGGWYDNAQFTGSIVTEIPQGTSDDYTVYARWYDDEETTVNSITVKGYPATLKTGTDNTYEVTIPEGITIAASDIVATAAYLTASVSMATTLDSGATWNFTVTSGSNSLNHKYYTINTIINHRPTTVAATKTGSATPASYDGGTAAVPYSADVSSWFSDQEGDDLTYVLVSTSAEGTVSLNAGILEYTPSVDDVGKDITMVIKANDGMSDSASNVTVTVTVGAIPGSDSVLSSTAGSFDKYKSSNGYNDISVVLTLAGNSLISIKNSGNALTMDDDYTVSSNTDVTITKEYLAQLDNGQITLIFGFNNGYRASMTITISDSYVAVTNITLATARVTLGSSLTLSGMVTPANASNNTIVWSLKSAGATGASVSDSTFSASAAGTAILTATIANGTSAGTDYVKDFAITVSSGGGGGGGGGGGVVVAEDSEYVNLICGDAAFEVSYTIEDNQAIVDIDDDTLEELLDSANDSGLISIDFSDVDIEEVTLPNDAFSAMAEAGIGGLTLKLPSAQIEISADAMAEIVEQADGRDITVSAERVNTRYLTNAQRTAVGTDPVYDLSIKCGSTSVTEFGGSVTISLPYELKDGEEAKGSVVWYLDSAGNLTEIPCTYEKTTKTVIFTVTHFSYYVTSYDESRILENAFSDVSKDAWYYDAVMFCAQNGITSGTGNGKFSPDSVLTRAQFIVLLMRAYGLDATANSANNFKDAGDTYYTGYLAAAKNLGITNGVGNNMFAPNSQITRQDMFVLLYRVLDVLDKLPENFIGASLMTYSDSDEISDYARDAMEALVANGVISGSGGKLNPGGISTRAQMAQVLYNLLYLEVE